MSLYTESVMLMANFNTVAEDALKAWAAKVDDVLIELNQEVVGQDKVQDLYELDGVLTIVASPLMGFENYLHIPVDILKDPDPVKAAKMRRINKRVQENRARVRDLRAEESKLTAEIISLVAEWDRLRYAVTPK